MIKTLVNPINQGMGESAVRNIADALDDSIKRQFPSDAEAGRWPGSNCCSKQFMPAKPSPWIT